MSDPLLNSLAAAVASSPEDVELRALYADRLARAGRTDDAVGQAMVVLARSPEHAGAQAVLDRITGRDESSSASAPVYSTESPPKPIGYQPHGQGDGPIYAPGEEPPSSVDWKRLEAEVGSTIKPPFIVHDAEETDEGVKLTLSEADDDSVPGLVTQEALKLSDVGGLDAVKKRIYETYLDPIAHPEIAKAFKPQLGGGLLLYGPPGCGKTYLARAIAGELGASFISVTLADVLSKWLGESEGNIHKTFEEARQKAPAVLFLDEIDAVGGKRSNSGGSQSFRNLVNQLLMEMDGIGSDNDGLFVLAATNMPWDVDPALLRPGRFDRVVLVSPPDEPARETILKLHLGKRPVEGIEITKLVKVTEGFSGADLKHLCDTAADKALAASIKRGEVMPITMRELNEALKEVKSSIGPWLDSARNVANYANNDGRYDDLVDLLKRLKRL
ncbi:AAA family ATPase [Leucobacter denitrificans]|uniref:AAA family ATPase n=1 Tax=Leucobacter denitrificans TaxID=683042 RepID=A0A7G9S2Y7_9MICO|nr:AAA family ATPase [Leucobacter denitrificans]QNN62212.1 AAA family ATPase [Leucobacter denitrificans]